ncbi:aminotransferase class III-fold pyridoxal phosphate-dependent enzyme [Limnochorda pilosa]|uniref:Uncharacterized protein n=1 Tax=Limnochorda pilosa TaxID=1555112 RepID=A0A0K2SNJ4_LIMPI|nr:aminotransferase class III-fold pyridoxal phosphate-dependent enzyme [Limnochorda pilosa]BAS28698.1 hypothetical protein LIP_2869 [Limnochorda pilosa]
MSQVEALPGREVEIAELTRHRVLVSWAAQAGLKHTVIDHAEGSYLYTPDGRRILDFSSGLICVNVGHNHPKVVEAIRRQAGRVTYVTPNFATDVRAQLADALSRVSPRGALVKTLFTSGGAEANENAIKIARLYTGRHKVLASYRSYHGATLGAMTLSGDQRRLAVEPGISGVVHFFTPYPYRSPFGVPPEQETEAALKHLEDVLLYEGPENVAAIFLEPVIGSGGLIVPPDGYLRGVREVCTRHGILMVLDEVMTGFGRTGRWFAAEHWDVVPDMITFAKGVTSGYVPLGGVMMSQPIARYFDEHVFWGGLTYSGHPLACAAGLANLEVYEEQGLVERAARMEVAMREKLGRLAERHPVVGDVRGKGMFWGIELVADRKTREPWVPWNTKGPGRMKELLGQLAARDVYVYGRWNLLYVAPPLTASEAELDEGVSGIDSALAAVA